MGTTKLLLLDSLLQEMAAACLILFPLLTVVVVDVNGQLVSGKSIIDCKGKEGKLSVMEEWTCHANGTIHCQRQTEDCTKGKAKGDMISAKVELDPTKKLNIPPPSDWHCGKICKKKGGCRKGSLNTVEEKECSKESESGDEDAKESDDDKAKESDDKAKESDDDKAKESDDEKAKESGDDKAKESGDDKEDTKNTEDTKDTEVAGKDGGKDKKAGKESGTDAKAGKESNNDAKEKKDSSKNTTTTSKPTTKPKKKDY